MPAIPPNRQTVTNSKHHRSRPRRFAQSLRVVAASVVLVVASQRGWSDGSTANPATVAPKRAEQSRASNPKSQASTVQFVAARERVEHSLVTRTNEAPIAPPVVITPTFAPPLSISDYENFIRRECADSQAKTDSAILSPSAQEVSKALEHLVATKSAANMTKAAPAPAVPQLRDIVLVAPPAPTAKNPAASSFAPPRSQSVDIAPRTSIASSHMAVAELPPHTDLSDLYKAQPVNIAPSIERPNHLFEATHDVAKSLGQSQLHVAQASPPQVTPPQATEPRVSHLAQVPKTSRPLTVPSAPKLETEQAPIEPQPEILAVEHPEIMTPRDIVLAVPPTQVVKAAPAVIIAPPESQPSNVVPITQDAPRIAQADIRPRLDLADLYTASPRVDLPAAKNTSNHAEANDDVPPPVGESRLRVAQVSEATVSPPHAPEPDASLVAQTPEASKPLPAPSEPQVEAAPAHTETMPPVAPATEAAATAAPNGPPTAMTSPNFLAANPESYCFRCGVKCPGGCNPGGPGWDAARPIPWEVFAQGEYIGPARLAHVPIYRLRVDDQLAFVYRLSGQVAGQPYRLNVRDQIQVQSLTVPEVINRTVIIQPDGTITLPLLGQIRAAGSTLEELTETLDEQFKKAEIKDPRVTVTPLEMNSNLQELRASVDRRYGAGGQVSDARVSPDGTVQLPAIGSVPAQGLTLEELEREIKARYAQIVEGLEVTPILTARAPRYVFVVGEVRLPGRFTMEGPTTLMQAISMAGSWNVGAGLNEVIVFRRDENWQLIATKVNIRESLLFKRPCPSGEIWLRDSDIVLVPKSPILCADDFIDLVFTRGIYGVFPMSASLNFTKLTSL